MADQLSVRSNWAQGTVITGTGFFGEHRQHIRSLVQNSGGVYSGDLLEDYTTHLVYKSLSTARSGEKYITALAWGIPVLPFSWLEESFAQQQLLPADCVPFTEGVNGLQSPASQLRKLSLQAAHEPTRPTPSQEGPEQSKSSFDSVSSQTTCNTSQDACSISGSNFQSCSPQHEAEHLQNAQMLQQHSPDQHHQPSASKVQLCMQQKHHQQLQQHQQEQQMTIQQPQKQQQQGLVSQSVAGFLQPNEVHSSCTHAPLHRQMLDFYSVQPSSMGTAEAIQQANATDGHDVVVPDSHPDDVVLSSQNQIDLLQIPWLPSLPLQQHYISAGAPAEAASQATPAALHQPALAPSPSCSGSETDVSAVPDSQAADEDAAAPASEADQLYSQLVTEDGGTQQLVLEERFSQPLCSAIGCDKDFACSSETVLSAALTHSALEAVSPQQQVIHTAAEQLAASPGTQHASLGTQQASPGIQHASPGTQQASPGIQHASRGTQQASRGIQHASPGTQQASPGIQHASPGSQQASPGIQHASPGTPQASPGTQHASLMTQQPSSIAAQQCPADLQSHQPTTGTTAEQQAACLKHENHLAPAQHTSISRSSTPVPDATGHDMHDPPPSWQLQSVRSSSRQSAGTTCATSTLVIDDSDLDSDFQTAVPLRPMAGRQSNLYQAAPMSSDEAHVSQPNTPVSVKCPGPQLATAATAAAALQSGQQKGARQGIYALKLMLRGPRGSTVKQFHGLSSLKGVQFAEQLQADDLLLNTKDKKVCVLLDTASYSGNEENSFQVEVGRPQSDSASPVIAEIQALYQLPSGLWWVEFTAFHTVADMQAVARDRGSQQLVLPAGTHTGRELFHGIVRHHARISAVQGTVIVRKSKQLGAISKRGVTGYFWRASFDTQALKVVTDRPVTDFMH